MKRRIIQSLGIAALLLCTTATLAGVGLDETLDGVLCLTPVADNSVIAVQLELLPGEAVSGLRWFNNDGGTTFPSVKIVSGDANGRPALDQIVASETNVSGSSLGWSQVDFTTPAGGSVRPLFAVFYMPAYQERTDEGVGGGPGIGYRAAEVAPVSYVGEEGEDWAQLARSTELAVEALTVGGSAIKAGEDVDGSSKIVYKTALLPPVPNPANPATNVRFSLSKDSRVQFMVYNQRGARVRELYQGKLSAGEHLLKWRGRDDTGSEVASGVYFIRMVLPSQVMSQRVVIVR